VKQYCHRSNKLVAKAPKPESLCDTNLPSKTFDTYHDGDRSHAQLQEGVKEVCTYDEALAVWYHAREIGLERFLQVSVVQRQDSLHTLCTAFGGLPPIVPSDP